MVKAVPVPAKRIYKKLTPPSPAMKTGAALGARAVTSDMEEGEVMLGACVAVWSLMTPQQRKERMRTAGVKVRIAIARMPSEQRRAALSMFAHLLDALDGLVTPDLNGEEE